MIVRAIVLLALAGQLSGCMLTPRVYIAETINFDAPPPSQQPMTYADLLCCEKCEA